MGSGTFDSILAMRPADPDMGMSAHRHGGVPASPALDCVVWLADIAAVAPRHADLLDEAERGRRAGYRLDADRDRFTAAAALLRLVASAHQGVAPAALRLDRTCARCGAPHGKPRLPDSDAHVSISHSGERVAVALTDAAPIGVDIELLTERDVLGLAHSVVSPAEPIAEPRDFYTYWCRKEAVVKATGDGLRVPLVQVVVSPASAPARLIAYPARSGEPVDPAGCSLRDLPVEGGYAAAVAVLAAGELGVELVDGTSVLTGWPTG
jgi:4'-phosphopantetheinyl transferase